MRIKIKKNNKNKNKIKNNKIKFLKILMHILRPNIFYNLIGLSWSV